MRDKEPYPATQYRAADRRQATGERTRRTGPDKLARRLRSELIRGAGAACLGAFAGRTAFGRADFDRTATRRRTRVRRAVDGTPKQAVRAREHGCPETRRTQESTDVEVVCADSQLNTPDCPSIFAIYQPIHH